MKKILYLAFISAIALAASCAKQDTVYKDFVKEGGYIYPAKPINTSAEQGYQRIFLKWEAPMDPSLRTAKVFWDNRTKSLEFNYSDYPDGKLEVVIDNLEDRSYTFNIVNYDAEGNASLSTEITTAPFGESWLVSHADRSVTSAKMDGDNARIVMTKSTDEMVATKFRYQKKDGTIVELGSMLPDENEFILEDAMKGKIFEYKSAYLPANGKDVVWATSWTKSPDPILFQLDVSNWKVKATNGQEFSSYTADKIFDGIISSSNRWHSSRTSSTAKIFPKILAIDTQSEAGNEVSIASLVLYQSSADATYRYIRDLTIYIGDKPYDPNDSNYEENFGEPVFSKTMTRSESEQTINIKPSKVGRYMALVFTNSYNTNGYIDLWELVPYGYIASEAE